MKIRLICAECKRLLKVPEEALNKKILCPACGAKFIGHPSLVRVKRQPQRATAGPTAAPPPRTSPDQQPTVPRSAPPASPPPPSDGHPAFDFPRLELDSSKASRPPEPQEPEVVESLEDLLAEPAPAEPEVVEEVPEVAFLHSEGTDSEVVDLTETHPEVLQPEVVSELEDDDDVIVPEVVEPEVVEALEPEVIESASLEPEVVEAAEAEVVEAAAVEPDLGDTVSMPALDDAAEPEVVEDAAEPEVVEDAAEPEVVEAVVEAPTPRGRRSALPAEDEDEPVGKGKKKKSGSGLLVGCLVGGFLLLLLGCGGGIGLFIYLGKQASHLTTAMTRMGPPTNMPGPGGQQFPPNPGPGGNPPQGGPAPTIPASEWKSFSPQGGNFTIDLPGTPVATPTGDPAVKVFALNRSESIGFTLTYTDLPAEEKTVMALFEDWKKEQADSMAKAFMGKVASDKAFKLNGNECREVVIEAPRKSMVIMRFILSKQGTRFRGYQLIAIGPEFRSDSGDAGKFFSSFRIRLARRPR